MAAPTPEEIEALGKKAVRIDYRRLSLKCAYCPDPATCIRVTATGHGDILVSTLCDKDAAGEKAHAIEQGMVLAGDGPPGLVTDATLIDQAAVKEVMDLAIAIAEGDE